MPAPYAGLATGVPVDPRDPPVLDVDRDPILGWDVYRRERLARLEAAQPRLTLRHGHNARAVEKSRQEGV